MKEFAIECVKEAGKVLMKYKDSPEITNDKGRGGFVTNVDEEAEKLIIDKIKETYPDHSIYAEESGEQKQDSEYEWFVDALDGTNNYIHGLSMFAVSLGLTKNDEPILGAVYFPLSDELFVAEKDKGATLNGNPIKMSDTPDLNQALIAMSVSMRRDKEKTLKLLDSIGDRANLRAVGSMCYNLCMFAKGSLDGVLIYSTSPWDIAASILIAKEAGAKISNLDGSEWSNNIFVRDLIVSNGKIHDEILKFKLTED